MIVEFRIDGETVAAAPGDSVAAAMAARGMQARSFCGMGVCHDCLVTVDGRAGQRACLTRVTAGMDVRLAHPPRPAVRTLADLTAVPDAPLTRRASDVVVVGAGPGGLSAATAAAGAGLRVVLLDERPRPGGQHFKQPSARPPARPDRQFRAGGVLIARAVAAGVQIESDTMVWGAFRDVDGTGELALLRDGVASRLGYRWLVVATGAYERPQVVSGWTLPGVMTTGACQTLLRGYGTLPGRRILFVGNGPLHIQTAAEVLAVGGTVAALADSAAPLRAIRPGLAMVASAPMLAARGLVSLARLRAAGVPVFWRHGLRRIEGDRQAKRAVLAPLAPDGGFIDGCDMIVEADTICLGVGFAPSSELPRLLGCEHVMTAGEPSVRRDIDGSTSVEDVFVVGEAGGFGGAEIALAQGGLAGAEIVRRAGKAPGDTRSGRRALVRARNFQTALWAAFAAPPPPMLEADVILCRCEGLTVARLRAVARDADVRDVASLKRLTRAGMGRCQGRYCASHLAAVVGAPAATERDLLAPQMPLRPVPVAALAVEKPEWGGHRRSMLPDDHGPDADPLPVRDAATVIVGAGIVGLATAYFLARGGHDVLVIDAGWPNAMASGGNAGSLHVQLLSFDHAARAEGGGSPAARTLSLQRDAVALWQALELETDSDFEIKITGGVMVAETEADLRFLDAKTTIERAHGIECHVIGVAELASLEPNLAPGLLGAAHCPGEGKINPLVATQALLDAARTAGARVFTKTSLRAVEREGDGFMLATNRGALKTGRLVNAAGGFASRIGAMLGHAVPVFGAPLQMIVTEPVAPLVQGLVAHADRHLTLKQAANGNVIIGGGWTATLDPVHHRPRPLRESLEGNLWVAQRVVPDLRKIHVLRSWAAMNVNIDGAPILGEHPSEPGLYNAVSSNGYTLGPLLGRITADLILRRQPDVDCRPFSIARFG